MTKNVFYVSVYFQGVKVGDICIFQVNAVHSLKENKYKILSGINTNLLVKEFKLSCYLRYKI